MFMFMFMFMLDTLYTSILRFAAWPALLVGLALTLLLAAAFRSDLPGSAMPVVERLKPLKPLDNRFFYTPGAVREVVERLHPEERRAGRCSSRGRPCPSWRAFSTCWRTAP